jgi:hypothetical protein
MLELDRAFLMRVSMLALLRAVDLSSKGAVAGALRGEPLGRGETGAAMHTHVTGLLGSPPQLSLITSTNAADDFWRIFNSPFEPPTTHIKGPDKACKKRRKL